MPRGLIGDMVTPLKGSGDLDRSSLKKIIEYTIKYLDGMIIGSGYTGEGLYLNNRRRVELIEQGIELVHGRVPLFLNVTGGLKEETAENIRAVEITIKKMGYPGKVYLLDCPLLHNSNRHLPDYYRELGNYTQLPFILYNNPHIIGELKAHLKRKNIRTSVLKELSRNEQIGGIIHTGDLSRAIHYIQAVRGRNDFRFYDGNEMSFLSLPSLSGVVSVGANLLPREWKEVTRSSLNRGNDLGGGALPRRQILKAGYLIKRFQAVYRFAAVAAIKKALRYMGKIKTATVTQKVLPVSPDQTAKIYRLLDECQLSAS